MYSNYLEVYNKTPYSPLEPTESNPKQYEYKFNSVEHMLSYVEALHKNFKRGSEMKSSEDNDQGEDWYQSTSIEDGIERIRETEFDPSGTLTLQTHLRNIRPSSRFSDDGYDIDVPEVLANSEKHWLKEDRRRSFSRFFEDTLFIRTSYASMTNAETARETGLKFLTELYKMGVIPRKVVCVFWATDTIQGGNEKYQNAIPIFIDVNFRDLNGMAKALHPALFRRLVFRIKEIFPNLAWGYGHNPPELKLTAKGTTSIDDLIGKDIPAKLKVLLGIN